MVLTSTDSSDYFDNKPNSYRVQLNKQIQFDGLDCCFDRIFLRELDYVREEEIRVVCVL